MKEKFKARCSNWVAVLVFLFSLQLFGAWTDERPDSTPEKKDTSTCKNGMSGTCHKEQVDSCRCVDCPGLQEQFPGCNCVQKKGTAYWQAWDGTCKEIHYDDGGTWYECEWPSEPQQSGDKANQNRCGT
jgi:hypothetical protein